MQELLKVSELACETPADTGARGHAPPNVRRIFLFCTKTNFRTSKLSKGSAPGPRWGSASRPLLYIGSRSGLTTCPMQTLTLDPPMMWKDVHTDEIRFGVRCCFEPCALSCFLQHSFSIVRSEPRPGLFLDNVEVF